MNQQTSFTILCDGQCAEVEWIDNQLFPVKHDQFYTSFIVSVSPKNKGSEGGAYLRRGANSRIYCCPVCRKLVAVVSSKSWLCVKSGCSMIRQVICRYASVLCTLSTLHIYRDHLTDPTALQHPCCHEPTTTLRHLLTNFKDRDEPNNRQEAVYEIKCSDSQASYV